MKRYIKKLKITIAIFEEYGRIAIVGNGLPR
jgi:hypothetical protein